MSTPTKPNDEVRNFIGQTTSACELINVYRNHPDYQQNDYIGWITRAGLESTCMNESLSQMPVALTSAGIYMKMLR